MSIERSRHKVDLLLLLALATLWGASYSFIRVGVTTIPPITLIAVRTLIAGGLLALWIVARGIPIPIEPAVWRRFSVQALLNSVLPFTLIAWAQLYVQAGVTTILNSITPVLAFLALWAINGPKEVTARKCLGVVAGMVGICLVMGSSVLHGVGDQLLPQLAIVAASACYAGASLYGRLFAGLSPVVPAAGSLLLGSVVLLPASFLIDHPWTLTPSLQSICALLALAVFSTALAFVIYFRLLQTLGSVATTAQSYLRVPIGVGIGVLFLDESMSSTIWVGLACVVLGVSAMTLPASPQVDKVDFKKSK